MDHSDLLRRYDSRLDGSRIPSWLDVEIEEIAEVNCIVV